MEERMKRTHYGRLHGIPVWLDMTDQHCPGVEARYFLDPVLSIMEFLHGFYCFVMSMVDSEFEPMYPILILGEVDSSDPS